MVVVDVGSLEFAFHVARYFQAVECSGRCGEVCFFHNLKIVVRKLVLESHAHELVFVVERAAFDCVAHFQRGRHLEYVAVPVFTSGCKSEIHCHVIRPVLERHRRQQSVAESGEVTIHYEQYRLPPGLTDTHVHTQMAYCNENMELLSCLKLAKLWGLEEIAFTEHSGHLYFKQEQYRGEDKIWYKEGLDCREQTVRTQEYLNLFSHVEREHCRLGMELDVDRRGRLIAGNDVLNRLELKVGAVHALEKNAQEGGDEEFFLAVKSLVESGIDILAHPFRIYSWDGAGEKPVRLFEPIVELLKKNNVAAEINFHHNRPDPVFTRMCIDAGVRIALGSDAHNLYEVGFFQPHLKFLREIGYTGELKDILFRKD